ncbi:hypothetical protein OQH60_04880 [Campylobacter sp. MIT 21-1685]|uniref:hypothetical protein n=1 Tax=unclassified Campylobacter TaxID=2593542 RepID=UPI00224ACCB2|nr:MULTISPECIES: hypothetical protein [unclassified Campylobacter]MCX2683198.1 hypothetical protein [Campylobacter sp. MIT 21-1684]MCX2751482.1 hypothetical protein [Campylobacter sp. MIT 21-1682]MCX2807679.1 hypothetical protein [Campylobacter sp. MIT 21-1685]
MKQAFSLLELTLLIVLLGAVFVLSEKYFSKEFLMQGAQVLLNDILYTRNLAMMQEELRLKDPVAKKQWYKSRWQLYFIKSAATNYEQTYTIFLDKNGDGNANLGKTILNKDREIAVDILNTNKLMNSGQSGVIHKDDKRTTQRFNIQKSFGIVKVEFKGVCAGTTRIIFDKLGSLYSPLRTSNSVYDKSLAKTGKECVIRLHSKHKRQLCIVIDALSGYAFIPKFQNLNSQIFTFKNQSKECKDI